MNSFRMKTLKIALLPLAFIALMSCGNGNPEVKQEMQLAEHVCNSKCVDETHMYLHGEKGHICSPACKRIREKKKS